MFECKRNDLGDQKLNVGELVAYRILVRRLCMWTSGTRVSYSSRMKNYTAGIRRKLIHLQLSSSIDLRLSYLVSLPKRRREKA